MKLIDICKKNNILLDNNNKLSIPESIKHVKLDIGLSYNAPFSTFWCNHQPDLFVFGFEPHPGTYAFLKDKSPQKYHPIYNRNFEPNPHVDNRLCILPVALSDKGGVEMDFFQMSVDVGVSSLFKPTEQFFQKNTEYSVESVTKVPVFTLKDFFDLFPFDRFPYIEYIKIDAQGSDLNIVKGAGTYLSERVVYITLEADGYQYEGANNCNENDIVSYMESIGFVKIAHPNTMDPTFLNKNFIHLANSVSILQRLP